MHVYSIIIVVGGLVSNPSDVIVCPGSLLSLTCEHNNVRDEQTRWETVTGNTTSASVALHDTSTGSSFGPFTFLEISDTSGPTLTSTVVATVTESLDHTVVVCRAGGRSFNTVERRVTVITAMTRMFSLVCSAPKLFPYIDLLGY